MKKEEVIKEEEDSEEKERYSTNNEIPHNSVKSVQRSVSSIKVLLKSSIVASIAAKSSMKKVFALLKL